MSIVDDFGAIGARLEELLKRPDATKPVCKACEGGGWEMYSTGHMDPHFRPCAACGNPEGHRCP